MSILLVKNLFNTLQTNEDNVMVELQSIFKINMIKHTFELLIPNLAEPVL